MKLAQLKQILISSFGNGIDQAEVTGREIVEQMFADEEETDVSVIKVVAYQINDTVVFLTNAGLAEPKNMVFVDLKNSGTLLQTVER